MARKRSLLEEPHARLEIVPMIDIMMFLLVFFVMIALRMIPDAGVTMQLPGAATATQMPATQVVIAIDKDDVIHVQDATYSLDSLQTYLAGVKQNNVTNVVIAADKTINFQQVMDVMDTVRKTGITDVGLATKQE
ncbi:MAG: ExbD/TolR family protein [Janthinobacterium lividum]